MLYEVVCTNSGDVLETFSDPKEASVFAKAAKEGRAFPVRIISRAEPDQNEIWQKREATRMTDGTYIPLPAWWYEQDWWIANEVIHRHHYLHWSSEDSDQFAFTDTMERGIADKQTRISPSRYLSRYFGHILRPEKIASLIGALLGRGELTISFKRKHFRFAYEDQSVSHENSSGSSCMGYSSDEYETDGRHPAEAYSTYDGEFAEPYPDNALAIAFVRDPDDEDLILSRAVVWPAEKTFVKVYGRTDADRQYLLHLLTSAGYTRAENFAGAHMAAILLSDDYETDSYDNDEEEEEEKVSLQRYLMPYIDNTLKIRYERSHFTILSGEEGGRICYANTTSGYTVLEEMLLCPITQQYYPSRAFYTVVVGLTSAGLLITERWSSAAIDTSDVIYARHFSSRRNNDDFYWIANTIPTFTLIGPNISIDGQICFGVDPKEAGLIYNEQYEVWYEPRYANKIHKLWFSERVYLAYIDNLISSGYTACKCGILFHTYDLSYRRNNNTCFFNVLVDREYRRDDTRPCKNGEEE